MSPKTDSNSSTRSASAHYPRRPSGQPKSSRQQFSACGACRMRRVRCDLKDITTAVTGSHPSCSNCKERELKCVDEFADVKAVKLLRQGRRLQQVEAIYGKAANQNFSTSSYLGLPTRLPCFTPQPQPEFFESPFWHWFSLQRPILDPAEFSTRFRAHAKGTQSLGHEGSLLAMLLVVWAASFGVDEQGKIDEPIHLAGSAFENDVSSRSNTRKAGASLFSNSHGSRCLNTGDRNSSVEEAISTRRRRKERSETMLREVLELVDIHAVMRRPTWDGARVLLLILPLLEDTHPLDRLTIHEASLSQAHSLCTLLSGPPSSIYSTSSGSSDDAMARARIFWYAHLQEGITTGMRGGRLVLNEDDLDAFQSTFPPFYINSPHGVSGVSYALGVGLPSPTSRAFPTGLPSSALCDSSPSSGTHSYLQVTQLFSIPFRLSSVCRKVHAVLTGMRAARRTARHGGIDAEGMRDIWEGLDRCWEEFEAVRRSGGGGDVDIQIETFVSGWQIFIFECHNIVRESLKQYASPPSSSASHSPSHSPPPYVFLNYLHEIASRKCFRLLPCVLSIIKHHLTLTQDIADPTALFRWDAGLVRDGCFFAAILSASVASQQLIDYAMHNPIVSHFGRMQFKQESAERSGFGDGVDVVRPGLLPILDADEGTRVCLAALGEMRWAFAKSEEREEAIRMIWEDKKMKEQRQKKHSSASAGGGLHAIPPLLEGDLKYPPQQPSYVLQAQHNNCPPLSLVSPSHPNSAPLTPCSTDSGGNNGWPSYSPPGPASSSSGTSFSDRGYPVFAASMSNGSFNHDSADDTFYHVVGLNNSDQFHLSAPLTAASNDPMAAAYKQHQGTNASTVHVTGNSSGAHVGTGYLDSNASGGSSSTRVHADPGTCAQFGDGFYH